MEWMENKCHIKPMRALIDQSTTFGKKIYLSPIPPKVLKTAPI